MVTWLISPDDGQSYPADSPAEEARMRAAGYEEAARVSAPAYVPPADAEVPERAYVPPAPEGESEPEAAHAKEHADAEPTDESAEERPARRRR